MGRARLQIIPQASTASLTRFLGTHVVFPGLQLSRTRGPPIQPRPLGAYEVRNVKASNQPAHVSLPGVHRLFSLRKRVLAGTYQGNVQPSQAATGPCPAASTTRSAAHPHRTTTRTTLNDPPEPRNGGSYMDSHFP